MDAAAVERGRVELGTPDGEWPVWAMRTYDLTAEKITITFTDDGRNLPVTFNRARFIEPGGIYEHRFVPTTLFFSPPHPVRVPRHPVLRRILGRWASHPLAVRLGLARIKMQSGSDTITFDGWRNDEYRL